MPTLPLPPFKPLVPGARIRVIAPANFVTEADMLPGRAALEAAGFEIEFCKHLFDRDGQFAGSDQTRAASLQAAFEDRSVDAIICARGGYGSPRILPFVDWKVVAANPKPFVGYSDLTAVLTRLVFQCAMPAFHGPVLRDLQTTADPINVRWLIETLTGKDRDWTVANASAKVIREGIADGHLVGGNLTLLASIAGSGSGFSADGAILLLEDISEYIYRLDRALVQMRQAGMLDGVRGVVISDLIDVEDGTVPFGKDAYEMIAAHFEDIPVVASVPVGHGPRKLTLGLGLKARLSATTKSVLLSQ